MVEEWRPVSGHSGYEVSDHGRVRSYRTLQGHPCKKPRIMKLMVVQGYLHIKLGRSFQSTVHRLVAAAFLGPCPEGMECRHLDGDRLNARLDNLIYGTKAENYDDRRRHGTHNTGERHGNSKLTDARASLIKTSTTSAKELAEKFGVTPSSISKVRTGRSWTHVPAREAA